MTKSEAYRARAAAYESEALAATGRAKVEWARHCQVQAEYFTIKAEHAARNEAQ